MGRQSKISPRCQWPANLLPANPNLAKGSVISPKTNPRKTSAKKTGSGWRKSNERKTKNGNYLDKLKEMESEGLSDEEKMKLLEEEQRKKDDEQAYLTN